MSDTPTTYSATARLIHWVSALLILILLVTGFRSGFSGRRREQGRCASYSPPGCHSCFAADVGAAHLVVAL